VRQAQRDRLAEVKRMRSAHALSTASSHCLATHRDRANNGLNLTSRTVHGSRDVLSPVRQLPAPHDGQERLNFHLDSLGQQTTSPVSPEC